MSTVLNRWYSIVVQTCKTGLWAGNAGPSIQYSHVIEVATLAQSLINDACRSSPFLAERCSQSSVVATVNSFISSLQAQCSQSPVGANVCSFGLNDKSMFNAVLILLGLSVSSVDMTPAQRVSAAVNSVLSVTAPTTYGVSPPSQPIQMANKYDIAVAMHCVGMLISC